MNRLQKSFSALSQLGPQPLGLYTLYRLGLKSGYWKWKLPGDQPMELDWERALANLNRLPIPDRAELADRLGADGQKILRQEAEQALQGKVRLFGGELVPVQLRPPPPLQHWTAYETGQAHISSDTVDPKFTWEHGRLGFIFPLGRYYFLSQDESCARCFWQSADTFLEANPPYQGPHWVSAQEVALRLIAFTWALRVFGGSPESSPERQARLVGAIAAHARRIPPTLIYARSQNNNHLLTESAGLFTAGLLLQSAHPAAAGWRQLGWEGFQRGIRDQVAEDGSYCQHSTNYHRLMLQISLWIHYLIQAKIGPSSREQESWPELSKQRLEAATGWLANLLDPLSGRVPNLGPNDGATILPLCSAPFEDFRPIVEAARLAFVRNQADFDSMATHLSEQEAGPGEMALWFGVGKAKKDASPLTIMAGANGRLTARDSEATNQLWGVLRAVHFTSRPGHADQLHLDLWWRGLNVAQDAGTYRYTAEAPWDNALTHAAVHNTVTVDGLDQMTRAGRFLYLDWAQAKVTSREEGEDGSWRRLVARQDGYRRLGIGHERSVTAFIEDRWVVEDRLWTEDGRPKTGDRRQESIGRGRKTEDRGRMNENQRHMHTIRLQWLLPDWRWEMAGGCLRLESPFGIVRLQVRTFGEASANQAVWNLVRGGEQVFGSSSLPQQAILGWISPTYAVKHPALSLVVEAQSELPVSFTSEWQFPDTM